MVMSSFFVYITMGIVFISLLLSIIAFTGHCYSQIIQPKKQKDFACFMLLQVGYASDSLAIVTSIAGAGSPSCDIFACFCISFMLLSSFITNCYGVHLLLTIGGRQPYASLYYLISACVSISMGIAIYVDKVIPVYPGALSCWFVDTKTSIIYFHVPRIVSGVVNFILFGMITYKLYQSQKRWGLLSDGLVAAERRLYLRMILFIFFTVGLVFQIFRDPLFTIGGLILATQGGATALSTNTKEIAVLYQKFCSCLKKIGRQRKTSDSKIPMEPI